MALLHYLILLAAAAMGGAVNAVAGGGTLLTFPALLLVVSPLTANATSTVALWPGALSSFWGYKAELGSDYKEIALLAIPSFTGGITGVVLLLWLGNAVFAVLVPYLILLATSLFMVQEPLARWNKSRIERALAASRAGGVAPGHADLLPPHGTAGHLPTSTAARVKIFPSLLAGEGAGVRGQDSRTTSKARWSGVLVFQFLVGVYGGYFGAGIGILMLAAFGFLGYTNIHHMNALKNLQAMCINGIAALLFILRGGLVDWRLALLMAAAAIVGGYAGAGTARRLGQRTVRRIIVGIGLCFSAWLFLQQIVLR